METYNFKTRPKNVYSTKELAELTGQTHGKVWSDIVNKKLEYFVADGCEKPYWIKKQIGNNYIKKYSLLKLNMPIIRSKDKQFLTVFWRYAIVELLSFQHWDKDIIPKICDYLNINKKQFGGLFYRSQLYLRKHTDIKEILNRINFNGHEIINDFRNFIRSKQCKSMN